MNIKNRLNKLENSHSKENQCVCTISDVPDFLTMQTLPKICQHCGKENSDEKIESFAKLQLEGKQRLKEVVRQVEARNE